MTEWADPRYTDVTDEYQQWKTMTQPAKPSRPGVYRRRRYGNPFVVVVDPATLTPYTAGR